ncbi:AAA family ATPase-like protein [Novymonas esmeraldas]|uniref:AAA family ATPase-like protein n=1 Tax=Novymonas esmeraldas TaxID=1808958 RepID=A0AAW0EZ70_9TRYP
MPAKKRLVPPIRPNADGTGFVRPGRAGAPARARSSGPRRPVSSTSTSSTSSATASRPSSPPAGAVLQPAGGPAPPRAAPVDRRAMTAALMPPSRGGRTAQTGDTRSRLSAVDGSRCSPPASAPPLPPSADEATATSAASVQASASPRAVLSASSTVVRGTRTASCATTSDAAPVVVAVGTHAPLGPSECLVAPRVMHRLGLHAGHLVQLSTTYGDVYAEVRTATGAAAVADRLLVSDDAAAVLVDLAAVALRPVLLPPHGLPVLRAVTIAVVAPEASQTLSGTAGAGCVVPSPASTMEWCALFRSTLHHKIAYAHLRATKRVLTHRVTLQVMRLTAVGENGDVPDAVWGLVTDATEVCVSASRSVDGAAAAGAPCDDTRAKECGPTAAVMNTGAVACDGDGASMCTLVVGEAGVGKSRWLSHHRAPARHTERVQVDQLPQAEGGEVSTATVLREVFDRARQSAPATLLIDDLHLICAADASSAGSRWAMSLLAHALADELLDVRRRGVDVRVVASAPSLASLDPCLTSSALFGGAVVSLALPNGATERLACLRCCLAELVPPAGALASAANGGDVVSDACLTEVAERAHGFTQRDLHRLVETAVVTAFQTRQSVAPTDADLRAASATVRPSSLKRFEVSVPNVTWADIGGSAEAKQTLCDVVEWCLGKQSWVFTEFNLTPPKGVLLYGPPGCSKTMLAKALANESHMNFISVKGPEVFSKWVGDSEKAVRDIFERARAASPCVVFIDELDGMCGHRGRGGVSDRVISQFLTELDGLPAAFAETKNALVFVAATNRPDSIDGAVLRPGRIDRRVYVGLPTLPERCAIAEIQFRHLPVAPELTASYVAARTEGYTGAEVVAVVKEAAFHAITNDAQAAHVAVSDVDAALAKVRPRINAKDVEWYRDWPHGAHHPAAQA